MQAVDRKGHKVRVIEAKAKGLHVGIAEALGQMGARRS